MKWVRLGDIASKITKGTTPTSLGYDFTDSGVNFIKVESVSENGELIADKLAHISSDCNNKLKRSQLQENDILFSIAGAIGRTAIVKKEFLPANTNQAFAIIRVPTEYIDYSFLIYALKSPALVRQYEKQKQGVAQINLSLQNVGDFLIPIFTFSEQRRIAATLDKVTDLISKRRQQLDKLDELVKARFVEMFGDRVVNNKNWNVKELRECATFYNGKAHEQVINENGQYILVTSKFIASDQQEYRKTDDALFLLYQGDICMVMSDVPNGRALAKCILIDQNNKYTLNQRICCFRNYKTNAIFLFYLLNRHEYFLSFDDGDSQTNLRKDDILSCPIILPPIELQNQFASYFTQIDKLNATICHSLEMLKTLKKSLMQEYFG